MADQRARYFRRLRRLRRGARRWSVLAGTLGGAAAILTPYAGLGLPDAIWAAAAGGSTALAAWRWSDLRRLAALPAPPAVDPALAGRQARARMVAMVENLPAGRGVLAEARRQRARLALRGTAAAAPWARLDAASTALSGLAGRLTGPADPALLEAAVAERSLRDLAHRVAGVERALPVAPEESRPSLTAAHRTLVEQLNGGVAAYERLVAAAAGYVAEEGRAHENGQAGAEHPSVHPLTEASEFLRGVAEGLAELRTLGDPMRDPMRAPN